MGNNINYFKRFGNNLIRWKLARKYSVAKCQAKYWNQPWCLTFEEYELKLKEGGADLNNIGRKPDSLNLCRIDSTLGWTINNTQVRARNSMNRKNPLTVQRVRLKDIECKNTTKSKKK